MSLSQHPHRRYNPLTGEWVMVSPHRTKRPWQGKVEDTMREDKPHYDETCYLCPGNPRAGGHQNPSYTDTFVFDNDFAALLPDTPVDEVSEGPGSIIRAESSRGICRVICFSPRHDLTISRMDSEDIIKVIRLWKEQYLELGAIDFINHVQIFENRGDIMGCSNPHPHGQIWAEDTIPDLSAKELAHQRVYAEQQGTSMLVDYAAYEIERQERLVCENGSFIAVVPYWAVWPYEVMILPRRAVSSFAEFDERLMLDLADIMRRVGIRFDNLFYTSFPYSMGIHQAPTDGNEYPWCQFHIHYLPPLLRSATIKKFMVGYELTARPQRDITAESSAETLRNLSEVHYLDRA